MKKLLLGLGTLSLAILPVTAMVSCTSETTLESEVSKFNQEQDALDPIMTTGHAIEEINLGFEGDDIVGQQLAATNALLTHPLPKIAEGFTIDNILSWFSPDISTSIEVSFTIRETATNNTAKATLKITNLTEIYSQALTEQMGKFSRHDDVTKTPLVTAAEAAATVTGTPDEMLAAVNRFLTIELSATFLSPGYTFVIEQADAHPNSVWITIQITETASKEKANARLRVTGFKE